MSFCENHSDQILNCVFKTKPNQTTYKCFNTYFLFI